MKARLGALFNNPAFCVIAVLAFLAAVLWCNLLWERWKAGVYAEEFQRRGMAPQAVPK